MNPQDIREKTFEKAVFGGYDMASVDSYLGEVSTELANAQRELTVVKSKMKVLVEKIEEYRANEDAMHMALLSAQKVSAQIQNEAEQKCSAMLESAQLKSEEIIGAIKGQQEQEQQRLLDAKRRSAEFLEHMRQLCVKQTAFLDAVSAAEPELAHMGQEFRAKGELKPQESKAQEPRPQELRPQTYRAAPPSQKEPAASSYGYGEATLRGMESSASKLAEEPGVGSRYAADYAGYDPSEPESDESATKPFSPIGSPKLRLSFDDLRFDEGK